MAENVTSSFPIIYQKTDFEDTSDEGTEEESEKGNEKVDNSNFSWGLTPLLITVCKETITPLHDIYSWAITEFLYYASYIVETEQKKLKEIKKLSNKR